VSESTLEEVGRGHNYPAGGAGSVIFDDFSSKLVRIVLLEVEKGQNGDPQSPVCRLRGSLTPLDSVESESKYRPNLIKFDENVVIRTRKKGPAGSPPAKGVKSALPEGHFGGQNVGLESAWNDRFYEVFSPKK